MVGAGFSLNATPIRLGLPRMPTWGELVLKLIDDLYPSEDQELKWHRETALNSSSTSGGMLRLAEEYAMAFGRDRLDGRLQEFVPDLSFEPSTLHEQLLRLPWRDVFTTNWDTLLERAARRLPLLDYQVVATPSDLSRSGQPRIVKLHGSFPHTRPFIVTEEDYRTYPVTFAPFVNAVRQAAMESVLCLIGFSGTDPNFLAWTGWVRDQLGPHQPHIFLVGLDAHSQAQRLLLERRGVRIIDLSRLPGLEKYPRGNRHRLALEWFLQNLLAGRSSIDPSSWPIRPSGSPPNGPVDLPPVPSSPQPNYPGFPNHWGPEKPTVFSAAEAALVWRQARKLYPDWVIAPKKVRDQLWEDLRWRVFQVTRAMQSAPLSVRLLVIRELLWQLTVCLMPPPETLRALILTTLKEVERLWQERNSSAELSAYCVGEIVTPFPSSVTEADEAKAEKLLWAGPDAVAEAWIELVFSLLQRARELGDESEFIKWEGFLRSSRQRDPALWARLSYERCLHAIGRVDHVALTQAVQDWGSDDGGDPYFAVRRASILAEMGHFRDAEQLCGQALNDIRQARRRDTDDIASLSREAWAMVLFHNLGAATTFSGPTVDRKYEQFWATSNEHFQRWRELSDLVGQPYQEIKRLEERLAGSPTLQDPLEDVVPAGAAVGTGEADVFLERPLSDKYWSQLHDSIQALHLCDIAGLPAQIANVTLTQNARIGAIKHLRPVAPNLATVAFLRVGRMDGTKEKNLFDVVWVALLEPAKIQALAGRAQSLLRLALEFHRANSRVDERLADYWRNRANFAAGLLGRLVSRLPKDAISDVAQAAIAYFQDGYANRHLLEENLTFLFEMALRALPIQERLSLLVELVSMPLPISATPRLAWPEPLSMIQNAAPAPDRSSFGAEFTAAVSKLLNYAESDTAGARGDALFRLAVLFDLGLLEPLEVRRFSEALWTPLREIGLPSNEDLRDDSLLALPQPEPGIAESTFRIGYLSPESPNPFDFPDALSNSREFSDLYSRLSSIIGAVNRRTEGQQLLGLSTDEASLLTRRLLTLIARLVEHERSPWSSFDRNDLIRHAQVALAEAGLSYLDPQDTLILKEAQGLLQEWDLREEPVLDAQIALLRLDSSQAPALFDRLERDLRSHRPERANAALLALERWILRSTRWQVPPPPDYLLLSVALLVEDGWPAVLKQALATARALVKSESIPSPDKVIAYLLQGLRALMTAADYRRGDRIGLGGIPSDDLPAIRIAVVRLASALHDKGQDDPAVLWWIEAARVDPLPDVRDALNQGG
jgi:hypothetical protein